jgi:ParB-like chromosome segregation protein Spo0J
MSDVIRVFSCSEAAERLGGEVIKASTLARLARERKVDHIRNGRKVGWTDAQLQGVIDYLAKQAMTTSSATAEPNETRQHKRRPRATATAQPEAPQTNVRPLKAKRGRRYSAAS